STGSKVDFFTAQRAVLAFLARFDEEGLVIAETAVAPDNALTISLGDVSCYLPLAGMVDLDKEKERLQKEIAALEKEIKRLTGLLNSPFAQKAPPAIVQKERDKLVQSKASHEELTQRLAAI
ncbi:MAG: valine--tRNA ligase, partial [Chloroflexi bacterium]|nr:valine--tRNA ligase [Chloroflexota bacterium]